jgi:hypothetical protein
MAGSEHGDRTNKGLSLRDLKITVGLKNTCVYHLYNSTLVGQFTGTGG